MKIKIFYFTFILLVFACIFMMIELGRVTLYLSSHYQHDEKIIQKHSWIDYFPHLKHSSEAIQKQNTFPTLDKLTNAIYTRLDIINFQRNYKVGDELNAVIEAKDSHQNAKRYGGDFFFASLLDSKKNGIRCRIKDYLNGTYKLSTPLLAPGEFKLDVILLHPSESVYLLMNITTEPDPVLYQYTAKLKINNDITNSDYTLCGIAMAKYR